MACVYIPTPALGFVKIVLIWFFFSCMCAVVTFSLSRQYIIDNWGEYKCNPLITPFAAAFGKNSTETMHDCLTGRYTALSAGMHQPLLGIMGSLGNAIGNAGGMVGDMSFVSGNVAGSFGDGLSKLMGQFANGGSTIQYLMIKIETLLQLSLIHI